VPEQEALRKLVALLILIKKRIERAKSFAL
jgi:hypothetical protein